VSAESPAVQTTVAGFGPRAKRLDVKVLRLLKPAVLAGLGVGAFIAFWAIVAAVSPDLPSVGKGLGTLVNVLSHPFYDHGPNDKGSGNQLATSLWRVFLGFGFASLVAVPLGFVMGASKTLCSALNPIVQLLRPVSPLAWYPIGLVVLKNSPNAAVFTIYITALWPTVLNTAFGVASVPEDHKNVARVFRFGRVKYIRHVLLPYSLPSILTGMRISMGVSWLVIVAVEMMSGTSGIGFDVWDAYNGAKLDRVISDIFLIGGIGVVLDFVFRKLQQRFTYAEVA
jgi:nitrate/nitrite transport system permease protein